jgi:hypothetical protein
MSNKRVKLPRVCTELSLHYLKFGRARNKKHDIGPAGIQKLGLESRRIRAGRVSEGGPTLIAVKLLLQREARGKNCTASGNIDIMQRPTLSESGMCETRGLAVELSFRLPEQSQWVNVRSNKLRASSERE